MLRDEVRVSPVAGDGAIGAAELARGLSYLRASNLQVMRLQLAAEQHDRRGVMAAIDELVGLDRELGQFIDAMPADAGPLARELDLQKRDMMAQRLMLARGKSGPALAPEPEAPPVEAELILDQPLPVAEWEEPETRGALRTWLPVLALALCAVFAIFIAFEPLTVWWESLQ